MTECPMFELSDQVASLRFESPVDCYESDNIHLPGRGPCPRCGYDIDTATRWENGEIRILTPEAYARLS